MVDDTKSPRKLLNHTEPGSGWSISTWCTSSVSFLNVVFHNLFPDLSSRSGVPDRLPVCFAKHLQKRHINVASTQLQGLCLHAFYLTFASRHRNLARRSRSRMLQRPENLRICWRAKCRGLDALENRRTWVHSSNSRKISRYKEWLLILFLHAKDCS